jgi:hypothetical protein
VNPRSFQHYFDDSEEEQEFPFNQKADKHGKIKKNEQAISSLEFKIIETVIQIIKPNSERNHNCKLSIKVNLKTVLRSSFTVIDNNPFVLLDEIKIYNLDIVTIKFESNNFDPEEKVSGTIKIKYEKEKK